MNNTMSFAFSVLVAVLLVVFVLIYNKKTKNGGADERQQIAQGKAYCCGFFTMIILNFLSNQAALCFKLEFNSAVLFLISILGGAFVFLLVCLWKDALITRIETKKLWSVLVVVWIAAVSLYVFRWLKTSKIEYMLVFVCCFAELVLLCINLLIKTGIDKNQKTKELTCE